MWKYQCLEVFLSIQESDCPVYSTGKCRMSLFVDAGIDDPPRLAPRLRKTRYIPLLLLWAFIASSRVSFTFVNLPRFLDNPVMDKTVFAVGSCAAVLHKNYEMEKRLPSFSLFPHKWHLFCCINKEELEQKQIVHKLKMYLQYHSLCKLIHHSIFTKINTFYLVVGCFHITYIIYLFHM